MDSCLCCLGAGGEAAGNGLSGKNESGVPIFRKRERDRARLVKKAG